MQFIPYSLYPTFIRPFLFLADAETAHGIIMTGAKLCSKRPLLNLFKQEVAYRPVTVMGLNFKNPVGLFITVYVFIDPDIIYQPFYWIFIFGFIPTAEIRVDIHR